MRAPDFFIAGAAKSGTTSLYRYLRAHPQVYMPPTKWINYYNRDLECPTNCPDREAYLAHFAEARDERRVGEASESYLYSRRAAAAIRADCPSARIVIMLRNPVDMMHSLHGQLLFSHVEEIEDFEEALAAEADRKAGRRLPAMAHHPREWLFYRDTARFAEQVERYLDAFGPDRVHIIVFDDFKADPQRAYRRTLEFLEVDPAFTPEFKVHNAYTTVRNRKLDRMVLRPSEPLRRIVRAALPSRALRTAVVGTLRRLNTKHCPRPSVDPDLRTRLQAEFAAEIDRLGALIGRDLGHWHGLREEPPRPLTLPGEGAAWSRAA